jgi:hypothetical protein
VFKHYISLLLIIDKKCKAVPLHAMKAFLGIGYIAPTHSWPRH